MENYDEYKKVVVDQMGSYKVANRSIAMRHRMTIGTIVSDTDLIVKYRKGGFIGSIEEWFVSKLIPGDVFTFAGKEFELIKIQNNQVLVKKSKVKKAKISWMGGRMSFSTLKFNTSRYYLSIRKQREPGAKCIGTCTSTTKKTILTPQSQRAPN